MIQSWVKDAVFYHVYPIGFCGAPYSNYDHEDIKSVVTIDKLAEWIPHLKEIGVNALYLGPVFESCEHGYDTKDYYKIDRRIGDNDKFKNLCKELHENDIKIVLDGVFNHVGREFWAFKDVQQNKQDSKYCSWFHNLNFGGSSPMGDPFYYDCWEGHFNLVKLNLHNPEVVDHIMGAIDMWMTDFGIDGIRLDVADALPDDFFRRLRSFCKSKMEDFWLMGEVIHGDYNKYANQDMLDSVTNYECYKGIYSSHNDKNYFEIAHSLNRQFGQGGIYNNIYTYNFVDNHDVNRLASTLNNYEHIYNCYTLMFTMPGAPSIYYGSEWGIRGVKGDGTDAPLRPCLDIKNIPDKNEGLAKYIGELSKMRRNLEALRIGDYCQIIVKNEQLVYRRATQNETVFVALNLAEYEDTLYFNIGNDNVLVEEFFGDEVVYSDNGNIALKVPPYTSRILRLCHKDNIERHTEGQDSKTQDTKPEKGVYKCSDGREVDVLDFAINPKTEEVLAIYKFVDGDNTLMALPFKEFNELL